MLAGQFAPSFIKGIRRQRFLPPFIKEKMIMKKEGHIKKYKMRVGLDWPDLLDDVFEIELPFSNEDIQILADRALRLYWVRHAIDTWEYIEAFLPELYKKGVALAEAYCVPQFGEQAKTENGARYDFFLPDEINDAVFNSEGWKRENKIRWKLQKKSKILFHRDARILRKAYEEGCFKNKLIGDPLWNNQIFAGIWSSESEDLAAGYGIHTLWEIMKGSNVEVSYCKDYYSDYVEFRVDLRPPLATYLEDFFSKNTKHYRYEDFEVKDNYMITKSKGDMYDIKFFMSFLEYLTSK